MAFSLVAGLLAVGLLAVVPARADPLGDRIAEYLCFPPSAERLAIDAREGARLLSQPPVTGDYRDIQGSEARAWFEVLKDGSARCRTPATSNMTLWFCAEVTLDGAILLRNRMRLCDLP
ncbi:MAG: hypothetical protein P1U88_15875 [Thalassobaculaceae bacterium]|nr:hypothetical protein [Thalassobaculaceae bacterium]